MLPETDTQSWPVRQQRSEEPAEAQELVSAGQVKSRAKMERPKRPLGVRAWLV